MSTDRIPRQGDLPYDGDRTRDHRTPAAGVDAPVRVDLQAVVQASQALSAQTDLDRLHTVATGVFGQLAGARSVRLLLWDGGAGDWQLWPGPGGGALGLEQAVAAGLVCRSAVRHAERSGEALVLPDAAADARFAADPYLAGPGPCALMVLPVTGRWARALLLLENRPAVAPFGDAQVGATVLLARQLAISLDHVAERRRLEEELQRALKLETVGRLASGIAHEINTPVQFVSDNLQFIADAVDPIEDLLAEYRQAFLDHAGSGQARNRCAELIEREREIDLEFLREQIPLAARQALDGARQVARIVRAMKAFAHPGDDTQPFADLNETIRNVLVVAHAEYAGVADLVTELDPLPPVRCDSGDLGQALLNLVVNAAQAMEEAAAAGRGRGTLTVRSRSDGDQVLIEVCDTGTGIPPQFADRVFDPFFTTKPIGVGSGQGLALARAVIQDRHGGEIGFRSGPGPGTTFVIRLPVDPEEPGEGTGAGAT
ncbi:MAG TPA: ATP-binding protein [Kineosporiaceae bacterium]|nr:ATP-binding protein [Kineosporiaceae bacterium]